jgi:hypothetical protein
MDLSLSMLKAIAFNLCDSLRTRRSAVHVAGNLSQIGSMFGLLNIPTSEGGCTMTSSRCLVRFITVSLLAFGTITCSSPSGPSHQVDRRNHIEDISSVPIKSSDLHQAEPQPFAKQLPRVESIGNCAPKDTGGLMACVNSEPCRGFGVRDENGTIFCRCFGIRNGCSKGERCDDEKLMCVDEALPTSRKTQPE